MVNRVTATEVKVIINTTLSDADINSHIDIANEVVTSELGSSSLSAARLRNIELYLSAHFIGLRDQDEGQIVAQWAGSEAKKEFIDEYGMGFNLTRYGQQAIALDNTGTLAKIGNTRIIFKVT